MAELCCRAERGDPKSNSKLVQTRLERECRASITPSPPQTHPSSLPGKSPPWCKREAYEGGATSTWPIEGVVESIVVVPVEEGEADVSGALMSLPEEQGGDVAPELEGGSHGQAHLVLRQVRRPVHHTVRQVPLGPAPACNGTGSVQHFGLVLPHRGRLPEWKETVWKTMEKTLCVFPKAKLGVEAGAAPPATALQLNPSEGSTTRAHPRMELQPNPEISLRR